MAFMTSQQLNKFYSLYKNISIIFSKEVMIAISFDPKQVVIRTSEGHWPCVINSVSMTSAKIICSKSSGLIECIQNGTNLVSLRMTFFVPDSKDTLSFFVSSKVAGVSQYESNNAELMLLNLEYTQRAPDDLIEKLGLLVEANIASKKRKSDRIVLTDVNKRKINLEKSETVIFIDSIPRRCILRDVSFSGVKILIAGVANFLLNKDVTVRFAFQEPLSSFGIKGTTIRAEQVEGRKDLVAVAVDFKEETVPMLYKIYLNRYFSSVRKSSDDSSMPQDEDADE